MSPKSQPTRIPFIVIIREGLIIRRYKRMIGSYYQGRPYHTAHIFARWVVVVEEKREARQNAYPTTKSTPFWI